MPKGKKKVEDVEPIIPVTEEPKVEDVKETPKVKAGSKPETQKPTGKFEKLFHDGVYYLVNVDGRILSAGDTEDTVDNMVMNLNNKRR